MIYIITLPLSIIIGISVGREIENRNYFIGRSIFLLLTDKTNIVIEYIDSSDLL